ncbi:hypothetical protein D3C80_1519060 [compost metagenome]
MHIVHVLQALRRQAGAGQQVDAAHSRFLLRPRPGPGVEHPDIHADRLADPLQQVGVGTDQPLRPGRIAPEIRGKVGITGGNQPFTFPGGRSSQRQEQGNQQQSRAKPHTAFEHRIVSLGDG